MRRLAAAAAILLVAAVALVLRPGPDGDGPVAQPDLPSVSAPPKVTLAAVGDRYADAQAVAVDPVGRIVTAGQLSNSIGVFRFDPAGKLDPSFGSGGHVRTLVGTFARATAVAVQRDDRIVVAGATNPSAGTTESDVVVVRYLPTGAVDATFGTRTFAHGEFTAATGIAIDRKGRVVVVGVTDDDLLVLRYRPNGTLDPTFGKGGRVITDVGGGVDVANAVAIDHDGRIVVAGTAQASAPATGQGAIVLRYLSSGAVDRSFRQVRTHRSPFDEYRAIELGPSGSILVTGSRTVEQQTKADAVVDLFHPDGRLTAHIEVSAGTFATARGLARGVIVGRADDQAFVVDAMGRSHLTSFGTEKSAFFAATVDGSGRVIAVGCTCDGAGGFGRGGREIPSSVVVARYDR